MAAFNLVRRHHDDAGHPGCARCLQLVKETYWFLRMVRFIQKYVGACLGCAFSKGVYGRAEGMVYPIPKPTVHSAWCTSIIWDLLHEVPGQQLCVDAGGRVHQVHGGATSQNGEGRRNGVRAAGGVW